MTALKSIAFLAVIGVLVGCNAPTAPSPPPTEEVRRLVILPSNDQIAPHEVLFPRAIVVTESGDTLDAGPIEWSSPDPDVLRIIPDGRVVGVASGTGRVIARTEGGTTAQVTVTVTPLRFSKVVVGYSRTCALTIEGRAYCWGDGPGWLGIGSSGGGGAFPYPERVVGGHLFTDIDMTQYRICALDEQGAIWCWGDRPVLLSSGPFATLAVGDKVCALTSDGRPWCSPTPGNPRVERNALEPVRQAPVLRSITAGSRHACGLDAAGLAWCWGRGVEGQLGDGQFVDSEVPVRVAGNRTFQSLEAGGDNTCGVVAERIFCWGGLSNSSHRVNIPSLMLQTVSTGPFSSLDVGASGGCALTIGSAWCWGNLGYTGFRNVVFPTFTVPLRSVSAWALHACGIDQNARIWCWGINRDGQLGDGTTNSTDVPVLVRDHAEPRY